eukprot:645569-Rhodomonas_salina.1
MENNERAFDLNRGRNEGTSTKASGHSCELWKMTLTKCESPFTTSRSTSLPILPKQNAGNGWTWTILCKVLQNAVLLKAATACDERAWPCLVLSELVDLAADMMEFINMKLVARFFHAAVSHTSVPHHT